MPMQVIPGFRISEAAIEKDIALMQFYGAEIRLNTPAPSVAELNIAGYTHIFFAVGAGKAGRLNIPGNVVPVIQWLRDLKAGKRSPWAMWRSSAAAIPRWMRPERRFAQGAASATLVYRRTKRYMPADAEELELAMADGVRFLELAAPVAQENGRLKCERMTLGAPDEKGRRSPLPTGELMEFDCDTVIAAVGEQVEGELVYRKRNRGKR